MIQFLFFIRFWALFSLFLLFSSRNTLLAWGFYAHKMLNRQAVYVLPPAMQVFFKPNALLIAEWAPLPDNRRYLIAEEGPRHFMDLDAYGPPPYDWIPKRWDSAVARFGEDSLMAHGIGPWWAETMQHRLTEAFHRHQWPRVLKLAAELGHYIGDIHVPLHACSNHNGQFTNQKGIHGFWESRIPELLAEKSWDFFVGPPEYYTSPSTVFWEAIISSAALAETVLKEEAVLSTQFPPHKKYAYEYRNGKLLRQYSMGFSYAYHQKMNGMVEKRYRMALHTISSCWFTAWVNAGQPPLPPPQKEKITWVDTAMIIPSNPLLIGLQKNWVKQTTGRESKSCD